MNTLIKARLSIFMVLFFIVAHTISSRAQVNLPVYKPDVSKAFYDSIVQLDSTFFEAYNNCRLGKMDSLISEDVEFFHDRGGLTTSKKELIEALKKNICGKVTRELLKGSIEVYEIPAYGAIEMGFHGFHNNQEKETGPTHFSKFVTIWQRKNNEWKMTRVISLH